MPNTKDARIAELEDALRKLIRAGASLPLRAKQRERWHAAADEAETVLSTPQKRHVHARWRCGDLKSWKGWSRPKRENTRTAKGASLGASILRKRG
jgi:hypothetical protein